jgi:hypothetical protein
LLFGEDFETLTPARRLPMKRSGALQVVSVIVTFYGVFALYFGIMISVGSAMGGRPPSLFDPHVVAVWLPGFINLWTGFALSRKQAYGWLLSIVGAFYWPAYGLYVCDNKYIVVQFFVVPWVIALYLLWEVRNEVLLDTPILIADVRRRKYASRIILVVTFAIWFVGYLPSLLLNTKYFALRHKRAEYYADFAAACDSVLAEHPLGTNKFVGIPVTDPSLPRIITDLKPTQIQVLPRRFWMMLGSDIHDGFGLTWEPRQGDTNTWVLYTIARGFDTVIYSSKR